VLHSESAPDAGILENPQCQTGKPFMLTCFFSSTVSSSPTISLLMGSLSTLIFRLSSGILISPQTTTGYWDMTLILIFYIFVSFHAYSLGSQVSKGSPPLQAELTGPIAFFSLYNSEGSDSVTWGSSASFDSAGNSVMVFDCGNIEPLTQTASPVRACSASFKDWFSVVPGHESSFTGRAGVPPAEIPTCSSDFADIDAHNVLYNEDSLYPDFPKGETEVQFRHVGEDVDSKCM
jgi:hypothetical protein